MEGRGIHNNSLLVAHPYDHAPLILAPSSSSRGSSGNLYELSARVVEYESGRPQLSTKPDRFGSEWVPLAEAKIVGIITSAIKVF